MIKQPARLYAAVVGGFLLLQGVSTLFARLYPPFDHAVPALLEITQMMPAHSILHIVTGLLAIGILIWGGERGAFWFAVGFGIFYMGLAFVGMFTGQTMGLGLQPFDHPFHILVGGLGLIAAGLVLYQSRKKKTASA